MASLKLQNSVFLLQLFPSELLDLSKYIANACELCRLLAVTTLQRNSQSCSTSPRLPDPSHESRSQGRDIVGNIVIIIIY